MKVFTENVNWIFHRIHLKYLRIFSYSSTLLNLLTNFVKYLQLLHIHWLICSFIYRHLFSAKTNYFLC